MQCEAIEISDVLCIKITKRLQRQLYCFLHFLAKLVTVDFRISSQI